MVNPFDRTFFRFVLGFTCIMGLSFAVFFIVGKYRMDVSTLSATPEKPIGASVIATTTATTVKPTSAAASLKLKTSGK